MTDTIAHIAQAAREAGFHVGLIRGKQADKYFRVDGHRFGHAAVMSIYRNSDGTDEVARLVWSYVSADRVRYGYALSFAGIHKDDQFVNLHEVRKVRESLGF